jgi:hypothetical protein
VPPLSSASSFINNNAIEHHAAVVLVLSERLPSRSAAISAFHTRCFRTIRAAFAVPGETAGCVQGGAARGQFEQITLVSRPHIEQGLNSQ